MSARPVIWVGAAGSATGLGVLQSARERWGDELVLVSADTNPRHLCAGAALADHHVQVPPATDPAFAAGLAAGLAEHRADVYVPIVDVELVAAAELDAAGALPPGVDVAGPGLTAARLCLDKLALAGWLAGEGLPGADTLPGCRARWRPGGVVLKPRSGWGSAGVSVVEREADLPAAAAAAGPAAVAQERCLAPEVTVDAFRGRDGALRAACRERLEVKAGVCTKARVFADAELTELAGALAERMPLAGAFCFQVMRSADDGGWRLTDVNPRPGGGMRMSAAVGFDVPAAIVADALGEDVAGLLVPPANDRWVVRGWSELVMETEEARAWA